MNSCKTVGTQCCRQWPHECYPKLACTAISGQMHSKAHANHMPITWWARYTKASTDHSCTMALMNTKQYMYAAHCVVLSRKSQLLWLCEAARASPRCSWGISWPSGVYPAPDRAGHSCKNTESWYSLVSPVMVNASLVTGVYKSLLACACFRWESRLLFKARELSSSTQMQALM